MKLPHPDSLQARLVHGVMRLAVAPLRPLYGGPVPVHRLCVSGVRRVPVPGGAVSTLVWDSAVRRVGVGRACGGRAVVLLHGLNANARYWIGTASLLQGPVYAPDQRFHGATGPLPGGVALEDTRGDLRAWLGGLGLEQVDLVGHSWGGKVALDFAAAHPERVRRLVLVDPVPPQGLHWLIHRSEPVAAGVFAPERGPFADRTALARAKARIAWLRHADPWMLEAFDANFWRRPDGAIHPVLPPDRFDAIYHGVLGRPSPLPPERFSGPVLLIRATFSAMPFYAQTAWLRRRLPQLRVAHVVGEHSLHATNPVSLASTIGAFLGG